MHRRAREAELARDRLDVHALPGQESPSGKRQRVRPGGCCRAPWAPRGYPGHENSLTPVRRANRYVRRHDGGLATVRGGHLGL